MNIEHYVFLKYLSNKNGELVPVIIYNPRDQTQTSHLSGGYIIAFWKDHQFIFLSPTQTCHK